MFSAYTFDICIVCLYFLVFHSLRFYCKPLTIFGKLILSSVLRIFPIAVQGVVVYVVKQLLEDVSVLRGEVYRGKLCKSIKLCNESHV